MARTASIGLSEGQIKRQATFDKLRFWSFTAHGGIVIYVAFGWLITSRLILYFYALLLPGIVLQWLLNGGCSIVNNFENLFRSGHWEYPDCVHPPGFFRTVLRVIGIRVTGAQITTALCSLMLIFWICAICRMMLIVSGTG